MSSNSHKESLQILTNKVSLQNKEDSRNQAVALRLGRICYFLLKHGRPDTDFLSMIFLHSVNGADVGDINHSSSFPANFLPHVSKVIMDLLKSHLSTRMVQTSFLPVINITADKATWKHETRQGIGLVTVVPDSEKVLQGFVLGFPVVTAHNGEGVAQNLTAVLDQFIKPEQFGGASFDGQYFHQKVDKRLDDHFKVKGFYNVDPMHGAGTGEIHVRKRKTCGWLVELTLHVSASFKSVNFGKEFRHFFEVIEALKDLEYDINFRFPRFFSETKFANYSRLVYKSFRETYPALIRTFEESQQKLKVGDSKDKEKAKSLSTLMSKIINLRFQVRLSGVCDIYERFGHGIQILQTINMLPHEKYDMFLKTVITGLSDMSKTVNPKDCQCHAVSNSALCLWPILHKDLREITESKKYRSVPVGVLMTNDLQTRQGKRVEQENLLTNKQDIMDKCMGQLGDFSQELSTELDATDFTEGSKLVLDSSRVILDLETLAIKVKLCGSAHVAAVQNSKFIEKARVFGPQLEEISDQELRLQFHQFIRKLEDHVEGIDKNNLRSLNLFRDFLSTSLGLYKDVEIIVYILCRAATSMGLESIVESWISLYEAHSNKHHPISNSRAENEIIVAVNGPLLQHADNIIKKSLRSMFSDKKSVFDKGGHFVRRSENIEDYVVSKSVDKFSNVAINVPFMC